MRRSFRTLAIAGIVCAAACGAAVTVGAHGEEEDDAAALKAKAKEALDKSIARGKALFNSKDLGKKTCASCHEDPDKPQFNLATRPYTVPLFSTKANDVVTMGQKINEMLTGKSKGKEMPLGSADLVALEAYVLSLRAK